MKSVDVMTRAELEDEVELLRAEYIDDGPNETRREELLHGLREHVDAVLRKALGECWNHLWGPGLEDLGDAFDRIETERRVLKADLDAERAYSNRLYSRLSGYEDPPHKVDADSKAGE